MAQIPPVYFQHVYEACAPRMLCYHCCCFFLILLLRREGGRGDLNESWVILRSEGGVLEESVRTSRAELWAVPDQVGIHT